MDKLSRTSSLDLVDQDEEDAGTFILELDKESGLGDSDRTYRTRIERGWAFALSKVGPLVGALGALAALGFIFAVWGGIPLGDPKEDLFDEDGSWPLIFITNPLVRTSAPPPISHSHGPLSPSHGTAALLLLVPHHHGSRRKQFERDASRFSPSFSFPRALLTPVVVGWLVGGGCR